MFCVFLTWYFSVMVKFCVLCVHVSRNDPYCVGWDVKHYSLTHFIACDFEFESRK